MYKESKNDNIFFIPRIKSCKKIYSILKIVDILRGYIIFTLYTTLIFK